MRAGEVPPRGATSNLEAYRLYQEGHYFFNQHHVRIVPEGHRTLSTGRSAGSTFALAYAGLADAYAYLAEQFVVAPREVMPKAKEAAEKALALDDTSAEAHTSLGLVKLDYERDRRGPARVSARHATQPELRIHPSLVRAFARSAGPPGGRDARNACRANPGSLCWSLSWDIANELLWTQRYDEALEHLTTVDELFPTWRLTAYFRVEAYHRQGRSEVGARTSGLAEIEPA